SGTRSVFFIIVVAFSSNKSVHQPSSTKIFRVDNTTTSELDSLSGPVYPGEVDVKRSLYNAEDHGYGVEMSLSGGSDYPVENIEAAVRAQGEEVKGIDDSWYRCLPQ